MLSHLLTLCVLLFCSTSVNAAPTNSTIVINPCIFLPDYIPCGKSCCPPTQYCATTPAFTACCNLDEILVSGICCKHGENNCRGKCCQGLCTWNTCSAGPIFEFCYVPTEKDCMVISGGKSCKTYKDCEISTGQICADGCCFNPIP